MNYLCSIHRFIQGIRGFVQGGTEEGLWWLLDAAEFEVSPEDQSDLPRHVRRPLRRVPIYPPREFEPQGIYPHYDPGPNAVRDCVAHYVEDPRPSGTVIVPRMHCYWRQPG